jgi:hypothetical protein
VCSKLKTLYRTYCVSRENFEFEFVEGWLPSMFFRLLKARKAAVTGAWLLLLGCIAVSISASQDSLHLGRLDGYQPDSLKGLLHAVQTVFRGQGGEGEGEGEGGSARGSAGGLVRASQQSFTGITLLDWGLLDKGFFRVYGV